MQWGLLQSCYTFINGTRIEVFECARTVHDQSSEKQIINFSGSLLRLRKREILVTGLKSTTNYIYRNTVLELFEKINVRISYSWCTQSQEAFLPFLPLTSFPSRNSNTLKFDWMWMYGMLGTRKITLQFTYPRQLNHIIHAVMCLLLQVH